MLIEKTLLLTRPLAAATRFDEVLRRQSASTFETLFSPIMMIAPINPWPMLEEGANVILTSAHAVRGDLSDCVVYCVGAQTAAAAQKNGAAVAAMFDRAQDLLEFLETLPPRGGFYYLCGSHQTIAFDQVLTARGIACIAKQVYAQRPQPLSDTAHQLLKGEREVVLPLFSRRSAALVGEQVVDISAKLEVISISDAVRNEWKTITGKDSLVSSRPTQQAMVEKILSVMIGQPS